MATSKDPWRKRARWIVELAEYSFTVEYIDNQRNVVADALSRLGHEDVLTDEVVVDQYRSDRRPNVISVFVPRLPHQSVNVLRPIGLRRNFEKLREKINCLMLCLSIWRGVWIFRIYRMWTYNQY